MLSNWRASPRLQGPRKGLRKILGAGYRSLALQCLIHMRIAWPSEDIERKGSMEQHGDYRHTRGLDPSLAAFVH
jgi:hypothetical protein